MEGAERERREEGGREGGVGGRQVRMDGGCICYVYSVKKKTKNNNNNNNNNNNKKGE